MFPSGGDTLRVVVHELDGATSLCPRPVPRWRRGRGARRVGLAGLADRRNLVGRIETIVGDY